MEYGGIIIELLIIFGIPILIPIFIILLAGKLQYNEKVKKIILTILSVIYNSIIGFISPLLFFCLFFLLSEILNIKILYLIIFFMFAIILIPINIYIIKKGKNKYYTIIYIILNIMIIAISAIIFLSLMKGNINL